MEKRHFGLPGDHSPVNLDTASPSLLMYTHIRKDGFLFTRPYLTVAQQMKDICYPPERSLVPLSDVLEHRKNAKTLGVEDALLHLTPRLEIDVQTLKIIGEQEAHEVYYFAMEKLDLIMSRDGLRLEDPLSQECRFNVRSDGKKLINPLGKTMGRIIGGIPHLSLPIIGEEEQAPPHLQRHNLYVSYDVRMGTALFDKKGFSRGPQLHLDPRMYDGKALRSHIDPSVQITFNY